MKQSTIGVLMLAVGFFLITWLVAVIAFLSARKSDLLGELLLVLYYALSIPALVYRRVIGLPVGLDLLTIPEMLANAVVYAVLTMSASQLLRAVSSRRLRAVMTTGIFVVLCIVGWVVAG